MAVSLKVYTHFNSAVTGSESAGGAPNVDWLSDAIYLALCTPSYTPNQAVDEFWSTPVANEVGAGVGYTTNGALLGTKTLANSSLVTTYDAADPAVWTATGAGFSAAYAVVYDRTPATDATRPLICYIDFGGTKTLVATDTLTITFNASGFFTVTVS